jgi:heat-inducible transcriptional repressor
LLGEGKRRLALVGASYGLANRSLGSVSLLGPVRMDYEHALQSVRAAASELSRFSEDLFGSN